MSVRALDRSAIGSLTSLTLLATLLGVDRGATHGLLFASISSSTFKDGLLALFLLLLGCQFPSFINKPFFFELLRAHLLVMCLSLLVLFILEDGSRIREVLHGHPHTELEMGDVDALVASLTIGNLIDFGSTNVNFEHFGVF